MRQVARVFLALVSDAKRRGVVVQQGGVKALLPLARASTAKGMHAAFFGCFLLMMALCTSELLIAELEILLRFTTV
jgi:hypothetical protein